jgi:hypothetical protein
MERKVESDWVNVVYKKVCSGNFHCTLAFQRHSIWCSNSRKTNSSFFRCIVTCKSSSCKRTFEIFINDEPVGTESIILSARNFTGCESMDVLKHAAAADYRKIF